MTLFPHSETQFTKTKMYEKYAKVLTIFFLVSWGFPETYAYCWQAGRNPTFSGPPEVSQIDLFTVLVEWKNLVSEVECADQFLVKYWQHNSPQVQH